MLGAGHHAVLLTPLDPRRRVCANDMRIGAERTRLHDGVARLEVEIAHGRKHPGETDRACLGTGDLPTRVRRIEIVEISERGGRRQLGETSYLLARAALEIRAE